MAALKVTDPFIRTGARESSSWPGVRSTSRPDTFLQTTSDNLEFLLDTKRRTIHFYRTRQNTRDIEPNERLISNCKVIRKNSDNFVLDRVLVLRHNGADQSSTLNDPGSTAAKEQCQAPLICF